MEVSKNKLQKEYKLKENLPINGGKCPRRGKHAYFKVTTYPY
jgi:hypothetical protein